MSAPIFTPGPWVVEGYHVYGPPDPESRHPNGRSLVGGVVDTHTDWRFRPSRDEGERALCDAEAKANALLIAAAPGLYDVAATLERLAGMSAADLVAAVTEDPSLLTTIIETAAEKARAARGEQP